MKRLTLIFLLLVGLGWAQTEQIRPTADSDNSGACTGFSGSVVASSTGATARDNNTGTGYSLSATGLLGADRIKGRTFTTWTTGRPYSALFLRVNAVGTTSGNNDGDTIIEYSINGGSSWTLLQGYNFIQAIYSATLSATQNLTSIQVRACAKGNSALGTSGDQGTGTVTLYEIYTEGTIISGRKGQVIVTDNLLNHQRRYEWRKEGKLVAWTSRRAKAMRWVRQIT